MQSSGIFLMLLFSVFALGSLGMQQSYATDYILGNDGTCGGLVGEGLASWDGVNTCTIIEELVLEDDNGDSLLVGPNTILVVPEETVLETDVVETAYQTAIQNTVDTTNGQSLVSFTLSVPSGNISITTGEIATLGTVTFP